MLIEAQNLAVASGLVDEPHWRGFGASLRKALAIAEMFRLDFMPEGDVTELIARTRPGDRLAGPAQVGVLTS